MNNIYPSTLCSGDAYAAKASSAAEVIYDPTVRENLDRRIANLENELAQIKASRATLGPLLDIKIRDIRRAMDY
jgi:hypothetical protein